MVKTTTRARLRRARVVVVEIEMSWETTDVLAADTADVLAADTRDVLAADTTDALAADTRDVLAADTTDVLAADKCVASKRSASGIFSTAKMATPNEKVLVLVIVGTFRLYFDVFWYV